MSLQKTFEASYKKQFDQIVKQAEQILKEEAHKKTGALADSITTEQKGYEAKVGVDAAVLKADARNIGHIDYSEFYWKGHGAYTIYPKNARALRWIGSDGQVHFAKYVRIPASSGDDFVERAVRRAAKLGG